MHARTIVIPAAALMVGVALAQGALARTETLQPREPHPMPAMQIAQAMPGHTTAPTGAPVTGSERGPGQPTGPGPMVTSPPGVVPLTGSARGAESTNSMPPGHMAADPNKPAQPGAPGPMVGAAPNPVPTTGSVAGAEPAGSMPPGHMAADPNKK